MAPGTRIPPWQALRCRIRYMTDGGAFGTDEFVDDYFKEHRERFGDGRKNGARVMKGATWGGLRSLRNLGVEVFG